MRWQNDSWKPCPCMLPASSESAASVSLFWAMRKNTSVQSERLSKHVSAARWAFSSLFVTKPSPAGPHREFLLQGQCREPLVTHSVESWSLSLHAASEGCRDWAEFCGGPQGGAYSLEAQGGREAVPQGQGSRGCSSLTKHMSTWHRLLLTTLPSQPTCLCSGGKRREQPARLSSSCKMHTSFLAILCLSHRLPEYQVTIFTDEETESHREAQSWSQLLAKSV